MQSAIMLVDMQIPKTSDVNALLGKDDSNIHYQSDGVGMHVQVVSPWHQLKARAQGDGIDLAIASGYRSYDRQQCIWNEKANGKRAVYDGDGHPLDIATLSEDALSDAIMIWSAVPGLSRHHWGTDFDIYDRNALPPNYQLQLLPEEYSNTGIFSQLAEWLADQVDQLEEEGFYRPYRQGNATGVAYEPWHISYRPLAQQFSQQLALMTADEIFFDPNLALMNSLKKHFPTVLRNSLLA